MMAKLKSFKKYVIKNRNAARYQRTTNSASKCSQTIEVPQNQRQQSSTKNRTAVPYKYG